MRGFDVFLVVVVLVGLYFLPTLVGASRKVVHIGSVFVINLLLGWSIVGWVVALAMALRTNPPYAHADRTFPRPAPSPGWYPDPAGTGGLRWWDGTSWTSRAEPPPGSPGGPGSGPPGVPG